jgi:hypothetical protein
MSMMEQGGYRKPNNPAPVSGPGSLSQRTDGGPAQGATYIPGLPYGQGQATYDQQVAGSMAGNPIPQNTLEDLQPLLAPTSRKNESITSGIDIGDGPGSIALGRLPNQEPTIKEIARGLAQYDVSGDSEMLFRMLDDIGY